jgi:3-keto-L-gulonate-6-phosphate decarboxylase
MATVCGTAPDSTIQDAVEAVKKLGRTVVAQMIGIPDVERVGQLKKPGVQLIELHIGHGQAARTYSLERCSCE